MSQTSVPVTVTLSENGWKAILGIIRPVCQERGDDWIRWEQEVHWIVRVAIQDARSRAQADASVKPSQADGASAPTASEGQSQRSHKRSTHGDEISAEDWNSFMSTADELQSAEDGYPDDYDENPEYWDY